MHYSRQDPSGREISSSQSWATYRIQYFRFVRCKWNGSWQLQHIAAVRQTEYALSNRKIKILLHRLLSLLLTKIITDMSSNRTCRTNVLMEELRLNEFFQSWGMINLHRLITNTSTPRSPQWSPSPLSSPTSATCPSHLDLSLPMLLYNWNYIYSSFIIYKTCKRDLVLYKALLILYNTFYDSAWRWLYNRIRNMLLLKMM